MGGSDDDVDVQDGFGGEGRDGRAADMLDGEVRGGREEGGEGRADLGELGGPEGVVGGDCYRHFKGGGGRDRVGLVERIRFIWRG